MPKIAQSNFDRGVRSQGNISMPTVEPEVAKALQRLGDVGTQIGAKMFKQQKAAEYLDWRSKKDAHLQTTKNQIRQDLDRMDLKGDYDYQTSDADGNMVSRKGNIYKDKKRYLSEQQTINKEGDGLWESQAAKRHYTAKENQLDSQLGIFITTRKNKILRDQVTTGVSNTIESLFSAVDAGDAAAVKKLGTQVTADLKPGGAASNVLGAEATSRQSRNCLLYTSDAADE